MLKASDKFQQCSQWNGGEKRRTSISTLLISKRNFHKLSTHVVVKWKYFDFEMGPRVQQNVTLINYNFMKLILIFDTNSFLYLILH